MKCNLKRLLEKEDQAETTQIDLLRWKKSKVNGIVSQLLTFIFFLCQILRPDPIYLISLPYMSDNVIFKLFSW